MGYRYIILTVILLGPNDFNFLGGNHFKQDLMWGLLCYIPCIQTYSRNLLTLMVTFLLFNI
jgi:hypothetical protein